MHTNPRFAGVALVVLATGAIFALPGCRTRRFREGPWPSQAVAAPVAVAPSAPASPAPVAATPAPAAETAPAPVVALKPASDGAIPPPSPTVDAAPVAPIVPSTPPSVALDAASAASPIPAPAPMPAAVADEPPPAPPPPPAPAAPASDAVTPAAPAGDAAAPPPAPVPAEKTADQILAEQAKRRAIEQDKQQFLVRQNLEAAKAHVQKNEYTEAETLLLKARDLDPTNRDVLDELSLVQQLLQKRGPDAEGTLGQLVKKQEILIDEQRTTAQKFYTTGRMSLEHENYDDAIENLQQALFIINSSPYPIDWRNLKRDAEAALAEAQRSKTESTRSARRDAVERSLGELAAQEEKRLIEEQQRLESLMSSAVDAFYREEYATAESLSEQVLTVQPDNTKATELRDAATAARHDKIAAEYVDREKQAFREWMDDMEATRNLEHRILKWPSQRFWDGITKARMGRRTFAGDIKSNPEEAGLTAKLKTTTVNLSVENRPFKEVVQTLQIQTQINIVIDPRIATDVGDSMVTGIVVENLPVETALDLLKSASADVVWTVQGNVVVFTKKEFVKRNLVIKSHSVADLVTGLTDFKPPRIELIPPDQVNDEEHPLFGLEGEDAVKPYGAVADLIELVKGAVGPGGTWEVEGASITEQGANTIIVKHTPEVQGKVAQFLNDLRAFAGVVVTIETRFLEVSDNFLRDVGVDFRGLGGQTPPVGTNNIVNLDDVTNGLPGDNASAGRDNGGPGLPAANALNPSAGAYFNDGGDGDFRGRTENIFNNPLGTVLSSLGGASFSLAYLDDSQYSMVVRAVEKTKHGRTLTAPLITVYNTQRANLTVVNQLSYIQDFDVEVAQTSFIADPIVGIIQDGLTLDVRPTVSNDRKYITLELQPTVAKLTEPIATFATSLASSAAPVIIQLPELKIQQVRTTVRIPDGGSILIGGLKEISTVDRQSEVPFIAKIPLLSFLFSRKGRSDEMRNLMILVKATITDLQEQEEKFRGR